MKVPLGVTVLVAIALGAAACGSLHRVKAVSGSFHPVSVTEGGPTKYACAAAWNRSEPRSAIAWERSHHVRQATVQEGAASQVKITFTAGQTSTTPARNVHTCSVVLLAAHGKARLWSGVWRHGAVASWGRPFRNAAGFGEGNACFARDGTIHRLGTFTAGSRCPRAHSGA